MGDKKIFGIGLGEGLAMALFVILVIIILKVIFNKYPVKGATDLINAV